MKPPARVIHKDLTQKPAAPIQLLEPQGCVLVRQPVLALGWREGRDGEIEESRGAG